MIRRLVPRGLVALAAAAALGWMSWVSEEFTLVMDGGSHGHRSTCAGDVPGSHYSPDPSGDGTFYCEYPSQGFTHGGMGWPVPTPRAVSPRFSGGD